MDGDGYTREAAVSLDELIANSNAIIYMSVNGAKSIEPKS
jgi:hypothetical protein